MPNNIPFYLAAAVTLGGAIAAMSLRNLVHCALCAAGAFAGLGAIYLQLGAEFVAAAQVLVYVGAIAMLIVFAILLTRGGKVKLTARQTAPNRFVGFLIVLLVCASLAGSILRSPSLQARTLALPEVTAPAQRIGENLMTAYVLPLETVGLLLTAAMLGAVVLAIREEPEARLRSEPTAQRRQALEEANIS